MEILAVKYRKGSRFELSRKCPHGMEGRVGSTRCSECVFHEGHNDSYVKCSFEPDKWQYKIVKSPKFLSEKDLGAMGKEGWELVSVMEMGTFWHYHFKKPETVIR